MAFPTTSILDSGVRANESPLSNGGAWLAQPEWFGDPMLQVVSNGIIRISGTLADQVYGTTFAADQEAYVTMTSVATINEHAVCCRATNYNTSGYTNTGYYLALTGSALNLNRLSPYYDTLATWAVTPANGDSFGLQCIGTTIKAFYKASGGSWTERISVTDSSFSGTGNISLISNDSSGQSVFNDFGGGDYVSGGGSNTIAWITA